MYAVGHIAIGYLTGKSLGKTLKVKPNLPLIFIASIAPDIDILIPGLTHRGPTHSIIILTLLFLPLFTIYGRKIAPYFIAIIQHPLIGDYITGGTQLLYPLTEQYYGLHFSVESRTNIITEWSFFLISMAVLIEERDLEDLLRPHLTNLLLAIPIASLLLPTFMKFPMYVLKEHYAPHIVYIVIFIASILIDVKAIIKRMSQKLNKRSER
ncbi:metal-dependent hydrolase [Candidatus Bathyarchaeota archaeon]|nr:metal-dependent hydrolase [Candidatus Bathyarchaeota archaeon]